VADLSLAARGGVTASLGAFDLPLADDRDRRRKASGSHSVMPKWATAAQFRLNQPPSCEALMDIEASWRRVHLRNFYLLQ